MHHDPSEGVLNFVGSARATFSIGKLQVILKEGTQGNRNEKRTFGDKFQGNLLRHHHSPMSYDS